MGKCRRYSHLKPPQWKEPRTARRSRYGGTRHGGSLKTGGRRGQTRSVRKNQETRDAPQCAKRLRLAAGPPPQSFLQRSFRQLVAVRPPIEPLKNLTELLLDPLLLGVRPSFEFFLPGRQISSRVLSYRPLARVISDTRRLAWFASSSSAMAHAIGATPRPPAASNLQKQTVWHRPRHPARRADRRVTRVSIPCRASAREGCRPVELGRGLVVVTLSAIGRLRATAQADTMRVRRTPACRCVITFVRRWPTSRPGKNFTARGREPLLSGSTPSCRANIGAAFAFTWARRSKSASRPSKTTSPPQLAIGSPLPTLPLWLTDRLHVPLQLEASYKDTCRGLRIA